MNVQQMRKEKKKNKTRKKKKVKQAFLFFSLCLERGILVQFQVELINYLDSRISKTSARTS